jgi:hypothetical protein
MSPSSFSISPYCFPFGSIKYSKEVLKKQYRDMCTQNNNNVRAVILRVRITAICFMNFLQRLQIRRIVSGRQQLDLIAHCEVV